MKGLRAAGEEPCPLLAKLAEDGSTAESWSKKREKQLAQQAKL